MLENSIEQGMFWVTVIGGLITAAATMIAYLLYRSETDPEVIIYPAQDDRRPSVINLVIENVGKGTATNIRFESDKDIPIGAFGISSPGSDLASAANAIRDGIPMLQPAGKRVFSWGQYGGLLHHVGDKPLEVKVIFRGGHSVLFMKRRLVSTCFLDVKSFEGVSAADHNYDRFQSEALKKIAGTLDAILQEMKSTNRDYRDNLDQQG